MASIFDTSAFAYVGSDDGYKNITKADMWNRYVDVVFENANYENDELKEFLYKQSEDEIVYEGANIDVHKKMKEAKSQYKASMKNIKSYVKNKQYSEAHREINIAITNLKIMRSETKEIMKYKETSDFTALKGMVIQSVIDASKLLLTVVTLGLGTVLAASILAVKNSTNFLSNIVQKNGDTSSSDFNQYYVNVIKLYDKMIKTLKNIDDEIHQMEKGNLPSQSKIADIKDKATDKVNNVKNKLNNVKESSDDIITEAYSGKTPNLLKAEKILNTMALEMKRNPLKDYTNSAENKELEKVLKDQFGFKSVYITWKRLPSSLTNVMTLLNVNVLFNGNPGFSDQKKGYYDNTHKHVLNIIADSNAVRYLDLTGEEYLAALLHELGHNFDSSPYMIIKTIAYIIKQLTTIVQKHKVAIGTDIFGNVQYRTNIKINPLPLLNIATNTNTGRAVHGTIGRDIESLLDKFPVLKKFMNAVNTIGSSMERVIEKAISPLSTLSVPLTVLFSPFIQAGSLFTRKTEQYADSFAAYYGFSVPLNSFLSKLSYKNLNIDKADSTINKVLTDLALANRSVIDTFISFHGSYDTRIMDSISLIENEIKSGDYPPAVKAELNKQVSELKEMHSTFINANNDNKLLITATTRKTLSEFFGGKSDYIAKLFPSYSYMDAYESAEFAEENSASVNAPMLPQGQGTGNSDPSIDDISKDLDNKINDGMSEIEEMVDEACGGQYIYTVDFLCESSLFKDTVDKVINKFKNLKTIDDNKLRRNIITKACKLYSSLVANQIRMNIEIAKDPKKGKTTVTYKKALANSIKIEKEIRKVTDRMTDAEKSFFESFKRELNQKSNITKKKLVDEAKKSAHMGKKVGIETESTDDENISSSINTLKRIYSKYLDLLEVKQEKIVYIKVGHPEKVKNHDSKIKKYQDIIDDLKKELTPIDLKKFNEFTSKADSVYSSYTPKIVKEITSSDDDDTEYIFMELNEEENKKIAQQFSKYLEDYLEESCNITTEASEVLLVSAASLATCAAVLATCAVGYAIDKGIRIRLQKQLNHYANKLHDDVIQFSKFEKRKNNNPYVIKKYSKEFYDKFVDANSEISIFTYYYEGKLMCMFISSQTSFTGNTTLFTANGSGSSYTSSKGPKQVKCVVISDICKKYQSYYEASMCVSHNIFDPCIKDFINDCKYELKHINETVEECGNGLAEEAANIDKEIENEIKKLNDKGYKTKYSSPGHDNIRIKNDDNKDGVYYGKLYNDARIMFDDKYDFPEAPKYWYWREVDGKSYLDIKPISYNEDKGSRDEFYKKWKSNYMASLNEWIDNLPNNGESKDSNEDTNDKNSKSDEDEDNVEENVKEFYESMMFDMFSSTGYGDII